MTLTRPIITRMMSSPLSDLARRSGGLYAPQAAAMLRIDHPQPLGRIIEMIPGTLPGTAAVLARHLADEDALLRRPDWLNLPPGRQPLVGMPCPACAERGLYVQTAGPESVWTAVVCDCPCKGVSDTGGNGCPCGMPGAVEGVTPIWPRHVVLGAVNTSPCCALHNGHCDPPADLCCTQCSEAAHPDHRPGERCVLGAVAGAAPTTPAT
ncbi:hypothetical protein ACNAW0_06665 [Micromonospora sp. SL1-18]|uniref:hypothetical protein n=1 Tax=Micromonospora sp. SL1-18 TaxID=3399128 RepID=UPI003A4E2EAB